MDKKSFRILLVKPKPEWTTIAMEHIITCEPLELEYLNHAVRDYRVELYDGNTDRRNLKKLIRKFKPHIFGMTSFITNVNRAVNLSIYYKSVVPDGIMVIGGVHGEVCPQHFFAPTIDFIVGADAYSSFRSLVDTLFSHGDASVIPGISYQADGEFRTNRAEPFNPDSLPIPERVMLNKHPRKYFYLFYSPCALIKSSYSCPYACNFCFCKNTNEGRYAERDIELVIEEMSRIPVEYLFFVDDNFLVNSERLNTFCTLLKERKINKKFIVYGRCDFIARHPDVIKNLKAAGLVAIIAGLEAVDDEDLEEMNKQIHMEETEKAVTVCRELDIDLVALFIIDPRWSREKIRRVGQWAVDRDLYMATYATYTPFPGTDTWESLRHELVVSPLEYELWDMLHLTISSRLKPFQYYRELLRLYMITIFSPAGRKTIIRKYGTVKGLLVSVMIIKSAAEFMIKLLLFGSKRFRHGNKLEGDGAE